METGTGWVKLHRKIIDWEWYQDANMVRVFLHCVLKANHKDKKWRGETIKRGSFVTSYQGMAMELKLSVQNIRTSLKKLSELTSELTYKSNNQYSVIAINNYETYQETNTPTNNQLTNDQQTTNNQLTTTKKGKNVKNEKEEEEEPPTFSGNSSMGASPQTPKPKYFTSSHFVNSYLSNIEGMGKSPEKKKRHDKLLKHSREIDTIVARYTKEELYGILNLAEKEGYSGDLKAFLGVNGGGPIKDYAEKYNSQEVSGKRPSSNETLLTIPSGAKISESNFRKIGS